MFTNPYEAGVALARWLRVYAPFSPMVIGLDGRGAVVAEPISRALGAPLDVITTAPVSLDDGGRVVGAVALGGGVSLDDEIAASLSWWPHRMDQAIARARTCLAVPLDGRLFRDVGGRVVILASDGAATFHERRAALRSLRARQADAVVLATPCCTHAMSRLLATECNGVATLTTRVPERFFRGSALPS